MGSLSSKHQGTSQYGQIYLKTDKTAYHAGETVTGTIFLNIIAPYPGNQLFIKLKGKEIVHLVNSEVPKNGKQHEDIQYSEKKVIVKQDIPVYSWDSLLPGQFTISFSFLLPQTLPPSFYQQGMRYLAFIEYQLEAFLSPYQANIPKMRYKQPINLRETVVQKTENLSSDVTTPLKTWCCRKQGSNILRVEFEKNYYSPGENAQVSMELDNSESQLKNHKVVFSLKQKLEVRAKGRALNFDLLKVKQELPGIPEGSNRNAGSLSLILPRFPLENDFNRGIDKKKPTKLDLITLTENQHVITSTTNSNLITSTFYLEVSCPMSGCCATLPLAKCPIGILSPEFQLPPVSAPNNWQPVTLSNVTLAFPSDKHQPLLHEYSNLMDEGQMLLNSKNQVNMEMARLQPNQMSSNNPTKKIEYNQNYFQKF